MQHLGKITIFIGLIICVIGIILYVGGDKLSWLGRLPGDIRIERENFKFYFPITTMILISIVVNILIRIFKKF